MKRFKVVTTVGRIALMSSLLAPSARADDWNRKTAVTFSNPVEIPGVHLAGWGVLPAGTYVFKMLDSQSDRHIVQIFNKDETTIYATILAIPNYRLKATDKMVITFSERPAGEPEALRAWFYPGKNWGEEFVYPKTKAVALAKAANAPVLFTPAEIPLESRRDHQIAVRSVGDGAGAGAYRGHPHRRRSAIRPSRYSATRRQSSDGARAHATADSSSSHGEQTAVDRAAGNDGPRRGGHRAYRRKAPSLVC